MADKTKAARAVLQSEIYRGRQTSGASIPGTEAVSPRATAGRARGNPRRRRGSVPVPPFTALALLGLLDIFKGG